MIENEPLPGAMLFRHVPNLFIRGFLRLQELTASFREAYLKNQRESPMARIVAM